MSNFHEAIRSTLYEVEKFLNDSLKNAPLSTSASQHKQIVIDKINSIRSEYPSLQLQSVTHVELDESTSTTGSGNSEELQDDLPYMDTIAPLAASSISSPTKTGWLLKKRKDGDLRAKLNPHQKRWCVLSGAILYYYEKPKDKKQCGAVNLTGYMFKDAPYLEKDPTKKDVSFELIKLGCRIFQFLAMSKDEYKEWSKLLQAASKLIEEPGDSTPDKDQTTVRNSFIDGETYEAIGENLMSEVYNDVSGPQHAEEETYDDADTVLKTPPPQVKRVVPPPRDQSSKSPDLLRRGIKPPTAEASPPLPSRGATPVKSPVLPSREKTPLTNAVVQNGVSPKTTAICESEQLYDDSISESQHRAVSEELYDDIDNVTTRQSAVIFPDASSWNIGDTQDYDNMYFAMWDCSADLSNELEFKRGDMLHILSKDYGDRSWWIAELGGKVGLVPTQFLTEAYEREM